MPEIVEKYDLQGLTPAILVKKGSVKAVAGKFFKKDQTFFVVKKCLLVTLESVFIKKGEYKISIITCRDLIILLLPSSYINFLVKIPSVNAMQTSI